MKIFYSFYRFLLTPLLLLIFSLIPCYAAHTYVYLWDVMRNHFNLQLVENNPKQRAAVDEQIAWLQKHPESLYRRLERGEHYMHYIVQSLLERQMPLEIALIPMIESEYNPFAYAPLGEKGLWQIMPSLASNSGLGVDHWVDHRRDIVLSTKAALDHFAHLHKQLGYWQYALWAYNAGEGKLKRILAEPHHKGRVLQMLPAETHNYLPKLLAIKAIITQPDKYGFKLPKIPYLPYFQPITLKHTLSFEQVATLCHIPTNTLRALNPSFRRLSFLPDEKTQHILLPSIKAFSCKNTLEHSFNKTSTWQYLHNSKGASLGAIAERYHMDFEYLNALNGIDPHISFSPKNTLLVHKNSKNNTKRHMYIPSTVKADKLPGPVLHVYTTKTGDTLERIAKIHFIDEFKIRYWNPQAKLNDLQPGQKLVLWFDAKNVHHRVGHGETLNQLALRYHTTVNAIKSLNGLKSDRISIGQFLNIQIDPAR